MSEALQEALSESISVEDAAARMGKAGMFVRIGLQQERLPFGVAVQVTPGRWNYHISRAAFEAYLAGEQINKQVLGQLRRIENKLEALKAFDKAGREHG